jgi:uncharacterized protein (TIGR03067 family)
MRIAALAILLLSSVVVAEEPKAKHQAKKEELKNLQGKWLHITEEGKETKTPFELIVIEGDKYRIYKDGKVARELTITVDPSTSPKQMDLTVKKDSGKSWTVPAIYELKGDVLRICIADLIPPLDRPKEFKHDPEHNTFLVTLKRKKE